MPIPTRALLCLLFAGPALAESEGGILTLGLGQQKILQAGNAQRVAIGDPEVADAKQVGGGHELLLTGVGEGRTSLLIWQRDGRRLSYVVVVRKQDPRELVSEVRALLGDREGIQIRVVGDHVYLDGETLTADDQERVQQIVSLYPQVTSFVRPSGNARRLQADALNKAFQKNGLRGVEAKLVGATLYLEGWVESQEDLKKLELVTRALGERAEKLENLVTVGVKRMILVEVDFVEVSSGADKLVGVKPPLHLVSGGETGAKVVISGTIPGGASAGSYSGTLEGTTDFSLGARFDRGVARVLSRPRLICASGEKAEFLAGGEVPILIATQNQFSVEWKKVGIVLNVTPRADRSGNIGTEIYAQVSDLDRTLSVRANGFDVPGFRVRDVKTNVTVRDGETVILSGLYNYSEDKEVSKIPLLGHIPILGELFKSRSFVDRKTELAIYVTPRIVAPSDPRVKELIDDARKLYKEAGDAVSFSLFD